MVTRYNITVPRKYIKDGEEKTAWGTVGKLVHFPANERQEESFIIELNMFPDTSFKVFPEKEREVRPAPQPVETPEAFPYPEEELNPDDIPF